MLVGVPERLKPNPPYISDCSVGRRRSSESRGGPAALAAAVCVSVREECGLSGLVQAVVVLEAVVRVVAVSPGRAIERLSDNGSL